MKIATYNVWNENKGVGNRFNQLINEINNVNADVIGLQEVTTHFFYDILTKRTDYQYFKFEKYEDEDEGLAILSRYPIENCVFLYRNEEFANSKALNVLFQIGDLRFSFTNVHLPWDSIKAKEDQIVAINKYMNIQSKHIDYSILVGDFNTGINSSVHSFLLGEQTINGHEANPCWDELLTAFSVMNNLPLKPTLDCINNPRWKGKNTMYVPSVMDRIYILDNWNNKTLKSVKIFGTDVSLENNLAASDHYGVVAEVDFMK